MSCRAKNMGFPVKIIGNKDKIIFLKLTTNHNTKTRIFIKLDFCKNFFLRSYDYYNTYTSIFEIPSEHTIEPRLSVLRLTVFLDYPSGATFAY